MGRVLIIEDDRDIASSMSILLSAEGHDVSTAADAAAGVEIALRETPDVVITDIWVPEGGGFEVTEKLRPLDLPVVVMTASRQPGLVEQASEMNAIGFLQKPFARSELVGAVDAALGRGPAGPVA